MTSYIPLARAMLCLDCQVINLGDRCGRCSGRALMPIADKLGEMREPFARLLEFQAERHVREFREQFAAPIQLRRVSQNGDGRRVLRMELGFSDKR